MTRYTVAEITTAKAQMTLAEAINDYISECPQGWRLHSINLIDATAAIVTVEKMPTMAEMMGGALPPLGRT